MEQKKLDVEHYSKLLEERDILLKEMDNEGITEFNLDKLQRLETLIKETISIGLSLDPKEQAEAQTKAKANAKARMEAKELPNVKHKSPEHTVLYHAKFVRDMFQKNLLRKKGEEEEENKRYKYKIKDKQSITYGTNVDGKYKFILYTDKPLNDTDILVYSTIDALWLEGNPQKIITTSMIYRTMHGIQTPTKVSTESQEEIKESIEKMRHIFIQIDFAEQLTKRKDAITYLDDYFINVEGVRAIINGQQVEGYRILSRPIFGRYCTELKQIQYEEIKLLDIKNKKGKRIKADIKNSIFNNYLKERIYEMKGKTPQSNVIVYETVLKRVYSTSEIKELSRKQLKKHYDYILSCLEEFKKQGYILDYKELEEKNKARKRVQIKVKKNY